MQSEKYYGIFKKIWEILRILRVAIRDICKNILEFIYFGMKKSCNSLFFSIVTYNQSERASQIRQKCRAGLDFCPSGIDWIIVICYAVISCDWQVVPPSCWWTCRQRKDAVSRRIGRYFYSRLQGHVNFKKWIKKQYLINTKRIIIVNLISLWL